MKVFFAGREKDKKTNDYFIKVGVKYRLLSFYYILQDGWVGEEYFSNNFNQVIIDSGLFTLMFGAASKDKMNLAAFEEYKEKYFSFISTIKAKNFSFVDLDVQKIFSSEYAWKLRREMKKLFPDKEIINTYHLEDGNPEELIEFSNYIALGIPELKACGSKKQMIAIITNVVNSAKSKGKKVHLLGMSGQQLMSKFRYADTCDSTNWTWYARSPGYKKQLLESYGIVGQENKSRSLSTKREVELGIVTSLKLYKRYAGNQD